MADQVRVFVSHHHSPEEDRLTAQLVRELEAAGADVWVDNQGITSGNFVAKISAGMAGRQWLVLVMTPAALRSPWVQEEVNTALHEVNAKRMLGVLPFVVQPCDERDMPLLWRALHRYDATRDYATARDGMFRAMGLRLPVPIARPAVSPISSRTAAPNITPPSKLVHVRSRNDALPDAGLPERMRRSQTPRSPNDVALSKSTSGMPLLSRRRMLIGSGAVAGVAALGGITWFVRRPQSSVTLPDHLASLGFGLYVNRGVQYIVAPLCDVPAGEFLMGSDPVKDTAATPDELPQNQVTLKAFQIAKHPLTVAEYASFVLSGYSAPQNPDSLGPVID